MSTRTSFSFPDPANADFRHLECYLGDILRISGLTGKPKVGLPASLYRRTALEMRQVADDADKLALESSQTIDAADFRVTKENSEAETRANRLRDAVRAAGGNKVVSGKSGVPTSTLHAYLTGQDWKVSAAVALAEACGVTLDWLVTGRPDAPAPAAHVQLPAPDVVQPGYAIVPRYDVKASAGSGNLVEREELVGHLALEENFVRLILHRRREDLVSIEATGDSMEPTIHDGNLLVVDKSVTELQNSRVYVLAVNGELLVKRLSLRLDGSVIVRSDNPKYEAETVTPSERNSLRIIGQVVYQAGPVRS